MVSHSFLLLTTTLILLTHSICDNYYQTNSVSSTRRPFDECYHSEINDNLQESSYRYICNKSDFGNDTVNGYTAFRQDFNDVNCITLNKTTIIEKPFAIYCGTKCEIIRLREYPIINASQCTYNQSIYVEDIYALQICDNDWEDSNAMFCSFGGIESHFWSNTYSAPDCDGDRLFESTYQFQGCQGDSSTYIEILECDNESEGESSLFTETTNNEGCQNYFLEPPSFGFHDSPRPFDICYRSYKDTVHGDYSYKYTCNDSYYSNYTVDGYTVFTHYYNGVGCQGNITTTTIHEAPYNIHCGGAECDILRYRIYDINATDTCNDDNHPNSILENNNYQEGVRVIAECDDDGSVSYAYFCGDDYFHFNGYNNGKCDSDGIYASTVYYEGCYDDALYFEVIECHQTRAPSVSTTTMVTTTYGNATANSAKPPTMLRTVFGNITTGPPTNALLETTTNGGNSDTVVSGAVLKLIIGVIVGLVLIIIALCGYVYYLKRKNLSKNLKYINFQDKNEPRIAIEHMEQFANN